MPHFYQDSSNNPIHRQTRFRHSKPIHSQTRLVPTHLGSSFFASGDACVPRYEAHCRASVISRMRRATHSNLFPSPREMESRDYSYSVKHSPRIHSTKGIYFDAQSAPTVAFHSWHADCTRSREYFEYDELNMCENFDAYDVADLGGNLEQARLGDINSLGMEMRENDVPLIEPMDGEIMRAGQRIFEKGFWRAAWQTAQQEIAQVCGYLEACDTPTPLDYDEHDLGGEIQEVVVEAECASLEDLLDVVDMSTQVPLEEWRAESLHHDQAQQFIMTGQQIEPHFDCFVVDTPISPSHTVREEHIDTLHEIVQGVQVDLQEIHPLVHKCMDIVRNEAPISTPLPTGFVADQDTMARKIGVDVLAAISAEKNTKSALSPCFERAMRCLELQRKIWAMGSSLCIIPAIPFHTFEDPFLLETCGINGVPIVSPMGCFQGVLLHNLSHQWSYSGAATTLSNKHFRLSSCVGQHLRREWLGAHLGARHTLWRPPETRTLFGTFWAVLRIWRIPTFHPLASRTKPSKKGENDVGIGYYFSYVSRHIVGERPPRARIRHVRLHSLATLLIRGRITSKRERMMQACKPSRQVMVVLAHLVLLGSTGARPSVRHQQHAPCPLVQPQHVLHLKAKPTQPLSKDHHAKAHHTKALSCFN